MENRRKPAPPAATLDINCDCKEYVVDYLDRAFPTQQMRPYTDETGEQRSEPMFDDAGNPVHNEEALQAKANLIEQLCSLPTIASALDAVINHYGTEAVAEVTGRTKRLVSLPNGQQRLEARSARTNQAEASSFMNDEKKILIFSDAGGTGRSYHASLDAQNQRQRVHLLLEPGWRADRAIQGLGRTHRTHQATTPLFRPCTTDCKGELRFTSTIARRLDSLGALTRGQRQTGGQNLFDPSDNLESEYAKSALITWFGLLHAGKLKSTTLCEFEHRSGLSLTDKDGVLNEDLPPIQRWLNRILALPINVQNTIFDEFLGLVEARVNAAREAGTLDVGVETIMVDRAKVVEDVVLRTDQRTGAQSHLLSIEVEKRFRPTSVERILSLADNSPRSKFMLNEKSGKAALVEKARSLMEDDGELLPRVRLIRPIRTDYMLVKDLEESAWKEIPRTKFTELWNTEVEEALTRTTTEMIYLATGLLLPIWSSLPRDYLNVNRIVDEQGQSWLGRTIDEHDVPGILQKFGLASNVRIRPDQILGSLKSRGSVSVERPWPMTFRQSLVNGEQRVELLGEFHTRLAQLKAIGCFTEIIQYKTRLFIPTSTAQEIITMILED